MLKRTDVIYCFKQAQEERLAGWPFMHPEEPLKWAEESEWKLYMLHMRTSDNAY